MRLLIAHDGSPGADAALEELGRAGLPTQVEAVVLTVADAYLPPGPPVSDASHRAEYDHLHRDVLAQVRRCRGQAEQAAGRLKQVFPNWTIQPEAVADSPGWGVIRLAEGWDGAPRADLVVVGAAGGSVVGRILLGSVSHKVMTYARCSVRISRLADPSVNRSPLLLVGVDGSTDASTAVRAVGARNWPAGTKVQVVCVADSRMKAAAPAAPSQGASSVDEVAEAIAERAANELGAAGLIASKHVTKGDAKLEILKQAEKIGADCVFVGARGLSRLDRILLGSVSTSVAMRATCSVEVVRPPLA